MVYVSMFSLLGVNGHLKEGDSFTLTAEIQEDSISAVGGVSINFLEDRPDIKPSRNILFHFNPRPSSRIILNSCLKGKWQDELTIEGNDLDGMLLQKPFDLTIKILSVKDARNACENKSEFEVYLNDVFLTTFRSPLPITASKFIGFSPCIRICKASKSVC
ncbi:uncharacterized protein LOC111122180 [Crassostrea virginica]